MKSDITNIRYVIKDGAFGDINKIGTWIYGKRPDGRTVACKSETKKNGTVRVFSVVKKVDSQKKRITKIEYETEFTREEWNQVRKAHSFIEPEKMMGVSNAILRRRGELASQPPS